MFFSVTVVIKVHVCLSLCSLIILFETKWRKGVGITLLQAKLVSCTVYVFVFLRAPCGAQHSMEEKGTVGQWLSH